jgi:type II secretory pathway component PulJ
MSSPNRQTFWRDRRGFGFADVMTSIAVFAVVGAAIMSVVIGTLSSFGYQARMMDAQLDVATAMALLQDDLRAAGYFTDNMNQAVFQQLTTGTTSDSITFVGDVNSDGTSERIRYAVDTNKNLNRTQDTWDSVNLTWVAGTAQPVAANITTFTLKFKLVDPCSAVISQQTATQVLTPPQNTTFITITLSGTGSYKGQTLTRTLYSDVTERQQNVRPTCT